ncbi:MAG: hypothetical protein Q7R47_02380 [Candidatus Diapherotrites archaeon]|nr:hypothetical protein [Candidatus Diapherotrites archaeon]
MWEKPCEPEIEAACDAWCREAARDVDALGTTRPPNPLLPWIFRRLSFAYGLSSITTSRASIVERQSR